jgi:RNA polymerase sigma-70 factor (ECF subfamily)
VDDHELFKRAREGDEEAFSELFARHQRPLFRYAAYMCGEAAADDVVQETFLAVLRQRDRRDAPAGTIQSYLFGIARHQWLKRLSSPRDRSLGEPFDAVRAAIRTLPPDYREVVIVCELEDMKYADAAMLLQCPLGTIRSRLHRAKTMLAAALAPSGSAIGESGRKDDV